MVKAEPPIPTDGEKARTGQAAGAGMSAPSAAAFLVPVRLQGTG